MRKLMSLVTAAAAGVTLAWAGTVSALAQVPFDLTAKHVSVQFTELPDTATSNSGVATLNGFRGWRLALGNESATAVTRK